MLDGDQARPPGEPPDLRLSRRVLDACPPDADAEARPSSEPPDRQLELIVSVISGILMKVIVLVSCEGVRPTLPDSLYSARLRSILV